MEMIFGMIFGIFIFMLGSVFPILLKRLTINVETMEYALDEACDESPEYVEQPSHYDELRREMERRDYKVATNPPQFHGNVPQTFNTGLYDDSESVEIVTELQEIENEKKAYR